MIVGVARVELRLPDNGSLKDKRRVVKSLIDRARRRFNVSIAEVDGLDSHRRAVLGFACVSHASAHADAMVARIVDWIDRETHGQMVGYESELR